MRFKWSDLIIIVIILTAFGYFYSRFDLDDNESSFSEDITQLAPPPAAPRLQKSGDLANPFSSVSGTTIEISNPQNSPETKTHISNNKPCPELTFNKNQQFIFEQNFNNRFSSENNRELLMITGYDHHSVAQLDRVAHFISDEQLKRATIKAKQERAKSRFQLLSEAYNETNEPLIGYLLAEHCVSGNLTKQCDLELLYKLAEDQETNLAIWLLIIDYAIRNDLDDEVLRVFELAGSALKFDIYTHEYVNTVYQLIKKAGWSNRVAYSRSIGFESARYMPIASHKLSRFCRTNPQACIGIGEILENTTYDFTIVMSGLVLQKNTYQESGAISMAAVKIEEIEAYREIINKKLTAVPPMPGAEDLFDFIIRNKGHHEFVEFEEMVRTEGQRLLAENPNLCIMNPEYNNQPESEEAKNTISKEPNNSSVRDGP